MVILYCNNISQPYDKPTIKILQSIGFPVTPKAKETHFRIFNGIYPPSELLRHRFNFEQNVCIFCKVDIETTDHFSFSCVYSGIFWENLLWMESKIQSLVTFARKHIMFGILLDDKKNTLFINVMFIMDTILIHKC